jgi:hypothetical protein
MNFERIRERAEASFKKKEIRALAGRQAMAEYTADGLAMREKTDRLKALRLARDAADMERVKNTPIAPAKKGSKAPAKKVLKPPAKNGSSNPGSLSRWKE